MSDNIQSNIASNSFSKQDKASNQDATSNTEVDSNTADTSYFIEDTSEPKLEESVESVSNQIETFTEIVESRRSIRRFTDKPIPATVLTDCLRLAMLAPSSSNLQPWEFYVIADPSKRKKASKICMNQNAAKTANKLIAIIARTDTWKENAKQILEQYPDKPVPKVVETYYGKLIPVNFMRGPANVVSVAKRGLVLAHRTFKGPIKTPIYTDHQLKTWAVSNTFLAAENLMLALRAYGFDSCPMGGFDEPAMKKLLGLHEHQHIAMMVAAGQRAEKGVYGTQFRFDFNKFVTYM